MHRIARLLQRHDNIRTGDNASQQLDSQFNFAVEFTIIRLQSLQLRKAGSFSPLRRWLTAPLTLQQEQQPLSKSTNPMPAVLKSYSTLTTTKRSYNCLASSDLLKTCQLTRSKKAKLGEAKDCTKEAYTVGIMLHDQSKSIPSAVPLAQLFSVSLRVRAPTSGSALLLASVTSSYVRACCSCPSCEVSQTALLPPAPAMSALDAWP